MTPADQWSFSAKIKDFCWPASYRGALAVRSQINRASIRGYQSSETGLTKFCNSNAIVQKRRSHIFRKRFNAHAYFNKKKKTNNTMLLETFVLC